MMRKKQLLNKTHHPQTPPRPASRRVWEHDLHDPWDKEPTEEETREQDSKRTRESEAVPKATA